MTLQALRKSLIDDLRKYEEPRVQSGDLTLAVLPDPPKPVPAPVPAPERDPDEDLPNVELIRKCSRAIRAAGPYSDEGIGKLAALSLAFLRTELALKADVLGWDALDLFSVFDAQLSISKCRADARGLLPIIAWAPWPLDIELITKDYAALRTGQGGLLQHARQRPARGGGALWWESRILKGEGGL